MTRKKLRLNGIFPPIPTPFDTEDELHLEKLEHNIDHLNRYDVRGYVVLGSNGEYVLLSEREKMRMLETARRAIPADKLLLAGTGCQSTRETIALTQKAADLGADAALVITPHYYTGRMTHEALVAHFTGLAEASPIPILLYNMPACTGIDVSAATVMEISRHPNVIGMKESGANIVKLADIVRQVSPDFQVIAGSANFMLPALSIGAAGGILALANIAPHQSISMMRLFLDGKLDEARELQLRMVPVNSAVTGRWGIAALKAAMDMLGLYGGPVRRPLLPVSEGVKKELRGILEIAGILSN